MSIVNELSGSKAEHIKATKNKAFGQVLVLASGSNDTRWIKKEVCTLSSVSSSGQSGIGLEPSSKHSESMSSSGHKKSKHGGKREVHLAMKRKASSERGFTAVKAEKFSSSLDQVIETMPASKAGVEEDGMNKVEMTLASKHADRSHDVRIGKLATGKSQLDGDIRAMHQRQESTDCEKKHKDSGKGKKERDCVGEQGNQNVNADRLLELQKSTEANLVEAMYMKQPVEPDILEKKEVKEHEKQKMIAKVMTVGKLSKEKLRSDKTVEGHVRKLAESSTKKKVDKTRTVPEGLQLYSSIEKKQGSETLPVKNKSHKEYKSATAKEKGKSKHSLSDNKEKFEKDVVRNSNIDSGNDEKKHEVFAKEENVGKSNSSEERILTQPEEIGKEMQAKKLLSMKSEKESEKSFAEKTYVKGNQSVNGLLLKKDLLKARHDGSKNEVFVKDANKAERNGSNLSCASEKTGKRNDASSSKHDISRHSSVTKRAKDSGSDSFLKKVEFKKEKFTDTMTGKFKTAGTDVLKSKEKIRKKIGTGVDTKRSRSKDEKGAKDGKTLSGDKYKRKKEKRIQNLRDPNNSSLFTKFSVGLEDGSREVSGTENWESESRTKKTGEIAKKGKELTVQTASCSKMKEKVESSFDEGEPSVPGFVHFYHVLGLFP